MLFFQASFLHRSAGMEFSIRLSPAATARRWVLRLRDSRIGR